MELAAGYPVELATAAATTTTLGHLHESTLWRSAARVRRRLLPALVIKRCCIPHAMILGARVRSTERRRREAECPAACRGRAVVGLQWFWLALLVVGRSALSVKRAVHKPDRARPPRLRGAVYVLRYTITWGILYILY